MAADGYPGIILYREIEIHKAIMPDGSMAAIVKADRSQKGGPFPDFREQLLKDSLPFSGVSFVELVVILAEAVGFFFFLDKLRGF